MPAYSVTDIGTLPGKSISAATGINSAGQVSGTSRNDVVNERGHAFLWQNGMIRDLGTLPGDIESVAAGISDAGWVFGQSFDTASHTHNAIWHDGMVLDTANLQINAMNSSNEGAGALVSQNPATLHSGIWLSGTVYDIGAGPGGGFSQANGINAEGAVTGIGNAPITGSGSTTVGYIWTPMTANGTTGDYQPVGIPGDACGAQAINVSGQIVVTCEHPTPSARIGSLYRWQGGTFTRIDPPSGFDSVGPGAQSLNSHGDVVGVAINPMKLIRHAFIWHNGASKDLNDLIPSNSGWVLTEATAINDQGSIVGNGTINGAVHACLLTPK